MSSRLFRLAEQQYPAEPVVGAVFARHERPGAMAMLLLALVGVGGAAWLGWPAWVGGAIGGGLASAGYVMMCENHVLVLTATRLFVHRPGRWWFRTPLGEFERTISPDSVHRERRGIVNDVWHADGTRLKLARPESSRLAEFLAA